jgi:hypothetical protein
LESFNGFRSVRRFERRAGERICALALAQMAHCSFSLSETFQNKLDEGF